MACYHIVQHTNMNSLIDLNLATVDLKVKEMNIIFFRANHLKGKILFWCTFTKKYQRVGEHLA